jgi:glycosyltransferase involved in cell wall biosynthesis
LKTKKALHVVASMNPKMGGVCQAVQTMIKGVSKHGIYNEVVCLDEALFIIDNSFPIHPLGPGKWGLSYNSKLIPWLVRNLARFDTIIIHGLWQYHSYAVLKALKLFKSQQKFHYGQNMQLPRIFIMPHGMLDPYFQKAKERKVKALRNWFYWKFVEGVVINNADGLFFTCEDELLLAREPFRPYLPKKEIVVGLGLEQPPEYSSCMRNAFLAKCPELKDDKYILFLGRIDQKKGVDILLEAYSQMLMQSFQLEQHVPKSLNSSCVPKLVIAGPGIGTSYGRNIVKLIQSKPGLKENVFLPGMLLGDVKWGALYGCDAFILSSHQENFGIAVVEALACGRPVLISKQVNIWREIIGEGGGIVAADTVEGTRTLLKKWLQLSEEKRNAMSKAAYSSYKKFFTIETATNRLRTAINS